ncbi:MBL fold metallo-hydrolase [Cyclobacterium amurskyense]|uniref:Outer membrane protein romA n=1 Tax=Cyclobacterium amurskyense TaxID=320787 RepID=A0A0H4PS60_9BACT|nr:MBL fold metallo-hydrolase [Cyclobacterium amurskyense]AKP51117.1 Outer membrane protein romA [Cyclobacterium amurskyense]
MKRIKKIIYTMIALFIGTIALIVIGGFLFLHFSPEFGGKASEEQRLAYSKSDHFKKGKFVNYGDINMDLSGRDMLKAIGGMLKTIPHSVPDQNIETLKIDSLDIIEYGPKTRLVWFGHSTFLLQISNKIILVDPMLGTVPAPHPMLGTKRFSDELPIAIEKIPFIDAVFFTHDHYDHLDYGSVQKLKNKVKTFYTPLGVGAHLEAWGVAKENIVELDWWEEVSFEELTFRCTPAQHFSGRGISDRAQTLWSSWIIQSPTENLFFSGDSGYAPHFKEIGERYGPFDLALLECGQYNELWPTVHMFPEQTAMAGVDVNAKMIMPIHWGAFKLSHHTWTDPVERVSRKARELGIGIITPRIGEQIELDSMVISEPNWWQQ